MSNEAIFHTEELVTLEGKKYLLLDGYLLLPIDKLRERMAQDFGRWLVERKRAAQNARPPRPTRVPGSGSSMKP